MNIIILILITFPSMLLASKIIELGYKWTKDGYLIITKVGDKKSHQFSISISTAYSFFTTLPESVQLSDKNETIQIDGKKKGVASSFMNDVSIIGREDNDAVIQNFIFYYVYPKQTILSDVLGFGFNGDHPSSLMRTMYNTKLIDEMKLVITQAEKEYQGDIYIGGLPLKVHSKYPYSVRCSIPNDVSSTEWGCPLTAVWINNDYHAYLHNKFVHFQADTYYNIAPLSFLDYMNKIFFNEEYKNGNCHLDDFRSMKIIHCMCYATNDFPDITLVINGYRVVYKKNLLFKAFIDECEFLFHGGDEATTDFIMGTTFMNNFAMVYDISDKSVTLMSKNEFQSAVDIDVTEEWLKEKKYIMIMVSLLCFISICGLFVNIKRTLLFNNI